VTFFGGFAFFVVLAEPSVVYASLGLVKAQAIGPIAAAASVATAILAFLFARFARFGAKVLLPIAFTAIGLGYVVVWIAASVAASLPGVIAGVLVASAGAGLLLPTLVAWAVGRIPFASRGRSTGVWTAAFFLGQFITPLLIGAIQGIAGISVAAAMGIVGIVCVVVAVALGAGVRPGPIIAESAGDPEAPVVATVA
jgi:MFS family permease